MENIINRYRQGISAEEFAYAELENQGMVLIERNFKWKRGEIDGIFRSPTGTLVFVEVKSAKLKNKQWLYQAIASAKIKYLKRSIQLYRQKNQWTRNLPIRFDVCWVIYDEAGNPSMEHWKNVELAR